MTSTNTRMMVFLAALGALGAVGCSSSHGREDGGHGQACGSVTCDPGLVCCNASCGICTAPGAGCPAIACVDAGPSVCGDDVCGAGEQCCPGCDDLYCAPTSGPCPDFLCDGGSPVVCGSAICDPGARCCPGCGPDEGICTPETSPCPDVDCPAPIDGGAVRSCGGWSGGTCGPDEVCDYPDGSYCGGDDSTGVCVPRPTACPEPACRPVCGCDGETYCSPCDAQAAGTDVLHEGACPSTDCDPMLARGVGACDGWFGVAWNGDDCVGISGCSCEGADCDSLYTGYDECVSAHASCFDDCRATGCPAGQTCQPCWVDYACLPEGAVC